MSHKEEIGSLIVEQQKHLEEFSDPNLRYFGTTIFSGQCGRFLGKLRRLEVIQNMDKIELFAADVGVYDKHKRDAILQTLERFGCIDVYREGERIIKIEEQMKTEAEILKTTNDIWEDMEPGEQEKASLEVIQGCTELPQTEEEILGTLESQGYKEKVSKLSLGLTTQFKMTKRVENIPGVNQTVYHTPLLGDYNIVGIMNKIRRLDDSLQNELQDLMKNIGRNQATPKSSIKLPEQEISEFQKLGLMNITRVETTQGREKEFVFTPSMWGPFGTDLLRDEQEHVRAMLSCVQFGHLYPTEVNGIRYPIKKPLKYVAALVRNRRVGPCTPIAIDYIILEREGIVELKPVSYKPGQYEMHLIKDDVAQRASRILERRYDIGLEPEAQMESFCQTGDFVNTVQTRLQAEAKMKTKTTRSEYLEKEILRVLRSEK